MKRLLHPETAPAWVYGVYSLIVAITIVVAGSAALTVISHTIHPDCAPRSAVSCVRL